MEERQVDGKLGRGEDAVGKWGLQQDSVELHIDPQCEVDNRSKEPHSPKEVHVERVDPWMRPWFRAYWWIQVVVLQT